MAKGSVRRNRNSELHLLNRTAQKHDIRAEGEAIIERLRQGDYFQVACRSAGVNVRIGERWLQLGKGGLGYKMKDKHICREEHVWFYEEAMRALAKVEGKALDAWMAEIEKGNWQAARDFLARRFPKRWSNSERRSVHVRSKAPAEIHLTWGDDLAPENPGGQSDDQVLFTPFASEAGGGSTLDGEV
ncbi:MAG TPA: hypothetical protein VKQ72_19635 [Aggregatilineales bacterium]|nr:hypothetical protein [Aggregatilineales bacterium]